MIVKTSFTSLCFRINRLGQVAEQGAGQQVAWVPLKVTPMQWHDFVFVFVFFFVTTATDSILN